MNILKLIRPESLKVDPAATALIYNNEEVSYQSLSELVDKTSFFLLQQDIKENNTVCLLFNNRPEFIITILALWEIGAVPVPLNTKLLEKDLVEQITFLNPKRIIKSKEFERIAIQKNDLIIPYEKLEPAKHKLKTQGFSKGKTALTLFTSGSSKKPKAVLLSFENLIQSALIGNKVLLHTEKDKWLASLPFYHIGGFSIIFRSLMFGTSIVVPASISNDNIKEAITKYHPTLASLVSTQLKKFVDINFIPPKELRMVLLGGGFSDKELILKAIDLKWNIAKVYGSTETSSFIAIMDKDEVKRKPEASGKAILPNQVFIYSGDEETLSMKSGEVIVKSPAVMKGYYKSSSETKTKLKKDLFATGDIGYLDEEGFLFVEAKRSDLIVSGGENIFPAEIEKKILIHKDIKEVCVIGIEDKTWGQVVSAAVMLKKNAELSASELKNFLKDKLAGYKIPKKILFVDELPKTELGKVIREDVRELFNKG
jgi:o-succinylbenzoate---CoA ligase